MTEEFSINNEQMGKRIRELREKEGLTQDALSEILSVGPNVIWRNGKCGRYYGAGRSFLGCG